MNKNIIKNYAIWARDELIKNVQEKARYFGIYSDYITDTIEKEFVKNRKRDKLIEDIQKKGYDNLLEEVAYNIFNRIIALYYMEVNGCSPYNVLIFSDEKGNFDPKVLYYPEELKITHVNNLDKSYINSIYYSNILIAIFFDLDKRMPCLFKEVNYYLDLIFPDNMLYDNSIVGRMVKEIDRNDFIDNVEIIGLMYQYYNNDKKDQIINVLNQTPIKKEDIPAATQIYTTDWLVRYMVDNTLGRYWIERNKNSKLINELEYLIKDNIEYIQEEIKPEELTIIDPCMGSGHILVYAIDVLIKIYKECGYSESEAILRIIKNNIYGLDIDKRVYQLAYFSVIMKALKYNKDIFNYTQDINLYVFGESNEIDDDIIAFITNEDPNMEYDMRRLMHLTRDAKEIGSVVKPVDIDFSILENGFNSILGKDYYDMISTNYQKIIHDNIAPLLNQLKLINRKYKTVVTNPPYLNRFSLNLKEYLSINYNKYNSDLYSVFMRRNFDLCTEDGYLGFVTPNVWMFVKTYESIRTYILKEKRIDSLIQIGKGSFYKETIVDICTFILQNKQNNKDGYYIRLEQFKKDMEEQRIKFIESFEEDCSYLYKVKPAQFFKIPSYPISYWINERILECYNKGVKLQDIACPRQGLATGRNELYVKFWYEVSFEDIGLNSRSIDLFHKSKKIFAPYNKGGDYCKWYGNNHLIIKFDESSYNELLNSGNHLPSRSFYFKESITWSKVSSGEIAFRYKNYGNVFDVAGTSIFTNLNDKNNDILYYLLGLNNSKVTMRLLQSISPTMNFEVGQIGSLPVIISNKHKKRIIQLVKENIYITKAMYDSYELSWDFLEHPFIRFNNYNENSLISDAYKEWEEFANNNYNKLKSNEEELNQIFYEIYGLDDISWNDRNEITISKPNIAKDVKSFLSYLVGIIFGRYSLERKSVQDSQPLIEDNVLLLTKLSYKNDICDLIKELITQIFGKKSINKNLLFISKALGNKGTNPLESIRQYFICDFYDDHYKTYKKTPIYWLLDAGKKKGFRALCYYHNFNNKTIMSANYNYCAKAIEYYNNIINARIVTLDKLDSTKKYVLKKKIKINKEQILEIEKYQKFMKSYDLSEENIKINDGVKKNKEKYWKIFN